MSSNRILLLAGDPELQQRIQILLDDHGYLVTACAVAWDAERVLAEEPVIAVLVDATDVARQAFLRRIASGGAARRTLNLVGNGNNGASAAPPVLALVADGNAEQIQAALDSGARDVVSMGLIDILLVPRLRSQLKGKGITAATGQGARVRVPRVEGPALVGESPRMRALADQMVMVAKSDMEVVICGESGTGKELVARLLHGMSPRRREAFVVANCTALPEDVFEVELFGASSGDNGKGPEHGASLVREADHGTLFLDELQALGPNAQAKLIDLIQTRSYRPGIGRNVVTADVRIIAAATDELEELVREGTFREDLYYRLNTLEIRLPTLRERLHDIPLLVDHFVGLFNARHDRDFVGFSKAALQKLQSHPWPGNVRELEGVVYRSLVMAGASRLVDENGVELNSWPASTPLDLSRPFGELRSEVIGRFERRYLEALLSRTRGNLSQAARQARHERKSLWRLLQKHDIDPRSYRAGSR